ncbi:MAG: hypothetical protein ACMXYB_04025 [Candidatus Woesearchaeota archaeon]
MKEIEILNFKLDNLDEKVVSRKQLLNLICDVIQNKPEKYLKKLRENKKIKALFNKYYYILSENERKSGILNYYSLELTYAVLNKSNIKWYISFEKGLELNNVLWQAHKITTIINNKFSKRLKVLDVEFKFIKTKSKYISNYSQNKTKNRITQNIATNEKIYVDYIYFNKKIPIELADKIDKKKVQQIAKAYPKYIQNKILENEK